MDNINVQYLEKEGVPLCLTNETIKIILVKTNIVCYNVNIFLYKMLHVSKS